jgi:hypothetical protein
MPSYQLVFDEALTGYREWWFPAALLAAGLWIPMCRTALRRWAHGEARRLIPAWGASRSPYLSKSEHLPRAISPDVEPDDGIFGLARAARALS